MSNRAVIVSAALCLVLSMGVLARTGQPNPSRVTGRLTDVTGAVVRGATVVLSTPEGETVAIAIASDAGGYAVPALRPSEYVVQVFAIGFGPSRLTRVHVDAGKDIKQDMAMDIGFVKNAIVSSREQRGGLGGLVPDGRTFESAPFAKASDGTQRIRLGGGIATGNLRRRSEPLYPDAAKAARIEGLVMLETLIGTDGTVLEMRPLGGHPLLIEAAVDAVKNWRYRPHLLNGAAVEVVTTVTVHFAVK